MSCLLRRIEFSLNVFAEFSDKKKSKRKTAGLELKISCVRDRDSTLGHSDFSDSL